MPLKYLLLDGVNDYVDTNALAQPTSTVVDFRIDMEPDAWTVGASQTFFTAWGTSINSAIRFSLLSGGQVRFAWADGGGTSRTVDISHGFTGSSRKTLRLLLDVTTSPAVCTLYESDGVGGWTLVATVNSGAVTPGFTFNNTIGLLGKYITGLNYDGRIYLMEFRNGDDGPTAANPDFTKQNPGIESFVDDTFNTWTLVNGASIVSEPVIVGPISSVPEYRVVVAGLGAAAIAEVPAKGLQFSYVLNSPGSISFTLPLRHELCTPEVLTPGIRELYIWRDNVKIWGGFLWTAQVQQDQKLVYFGGEGFLSKLKHRHVLVDRNYDATDVFDYAWDLIDYTQGLTNGNFGISRFSATQAGVTIDRHFKGYEKKNILDELHKLACRDGGIDYEITPDKEFKNYLQQGSATTHVFELGKNIRSAYQNSDATLSASDAIGIGKSEAETVQTSHQTDATFQASVGRLEKTFSFKDAEDQTTLDARTVEALRLSKVIRSAPTIQIIDGDPAFGDYGIGDNVRVKIDQGYLQVDRMLRIQSITVALANSGREAIGLYFVEEKVED